MPRCRACGQNYTGAYHLNCPAHYPASTDPAAPQGQVNATGQHPSAPPVAPVPPVMVPGPPPVPDGRYPITGSEPGQPNRGVPLSPTLGLPTLPLPPSPPANRPAPPVVAPQLPQAPNQPAPPQPIGYAPRGTRPVIDHEPPPPGHIRGIVQNGRNDQIRRFLGATGYATITGLICLTLSLAAVHPCLFVLGVVGMVSIRGLIWRLLLPDTPVPTWSCQLFDMTAQVSRAVRITNPEGVPPENGAIIEVRGYQRGPHFEAEVIRRLRDAQGNQAVGDQLIAREFPPRSFAYGLLLLGLVSMVYTAFVLSSWWVGFVSQLPL